MKRTLIVSMALVLSGCYVQHDIGFMNSPCLKPYAGFDFELGSDFLIQVNERIYSVPKGFITDLASTPRFMWSLYPPNDTRTIRAAVFHDYLYSGSVEISRQEADSILYDSLVYQDISKFRAFKYWVAVRLFGSSRFMGYKKQ